MASRHAHKGPRVATGLLGALLAACLQIFVLAGAMPDPAHAAGLPSIAICGVDHTAPQAPVHHHGLKLRCTDCPGCHLAAHAGAPLPQSAPSLFVPFITPVATRIFADAAPPTGPPVGASLPRGPPISA